MIREPASNKSPDCVGDASNRDKEGCVSGTDTVGLGEGRQVGVGDVDGGEGEEVGQGEEEVGGEHGVGGQVITQHQHCSPLTGLASPRGHVTRPDTWAGHVHRDHGQASQHCHQGQS